MCFVPGHGEEMWKGKDRKEGKEGQSGEEKEIKPKGRREDDMCQRGSSLHTDQIFSLGRRDEKSWPTYLE